MGWRPIETHNERDTLADVLVSDGARVAVAWRDGAGEWNDSMAGDSGDDWLGWRPTHWMPFPEPPAIADTLPKGEDRETGLRAEQG